ncbi:MAG: RNA-binding domain-containing protein [archaeon]
MKLAHKVVISVFCREEDNEDEIKKVLKALIPEKIPITKKSASGFEGRIIVVLEASMDKQRHTTGFLNNFTESLPPDQKHRLISELDSRIDEHLHLFIRLEKGAALKNEFLLTDSGDCFHIRINLAVFPHKKEKAIGLAEAIFKP